MKRMELTKATSSLAGYAASVRKDAMIFTRHGKPVAALVSLENTDWETIRLSTHPQFMEIVKRSRACHRREGGLTEAEVRRRLKACG